MNAIRSSILCATAVTIAVSTWIFWKPGEAGHPSPHPIADSSRLVSKAAAPSVAVPTAKSTWVTSMGQKSHSATYQEATTRYERVRKCYAVQNRAFSARNLADACQEVSRNSTTSVGMQCQRLEASLEEAARELAACADRDSTPRAFFEATKMAAAAGNRSAQACYVQGRYEGGGISMGYSPEDMADYHRDAPRYISNGLARGDWRIVSLLARHGNVGDAYDPLKTITRDDPYQAYVMNRLLQLGATPKYAQDIEMQIRSEFLAPGFNTGPFITPDQAARGRSDAQELFRQSFANQTPLEGDPAICAGS